MPLHLRGWGTDRVIEEEAAISLVAKKIAQALAQPDALHRLRHCSEGGEAFKVVQADFEAVVAIVDGKVDAVLAVVGDQVWKINRPNGETWELIAKRWSSRPVAA